MTGKPFAAIALSAAWACALAGCVIPEPITEDPPAQVPDQGLVIEKALPSDATVTAIAASGGVCTVSVELPQVLDPGAANANAPAVFARFFINLNNPDANEVVTPYPLSFEGSGGPNTDLPLEPADQDDPTQLSLGEETINLSNYSNYLTQPSGGAPQPNTLEVFVSDGFSDDPTELWAPSAQASYDHFSWYIDLTNCPTLYVP